LRMLLRREFSARKCSSGGGGEFGVCDHVFVHGIVRLHHCPGSINPAGCGVVAKLLNEKYESDHDGERTENLPNGSNRIPVHQPPPEQPSMSLSKTQAVTPKLVQLPNGLLQQAQAALLCET